MRILYLIFLFITVIQNKLLIKDAGISSITRGDIGMIFYIKVENSGDTNYNVIVKMEKCCEVFSATDMDCQMMQLIGGNMGSIEPKQTKHLSLIYPNMYLHNRRGQCLIKIKYRIYTQIKVKIEFDTTLRKDKINKAMRGYYSKNILATCSSIDLDPLDRCVPVNCEMKYLGSRNFFNHYWNRCQKVPICIADLSKGLPDVSYVPICNQCKDLENVLSSDDVNYLQTGKIEECWEAQVAPLLSANIRCHHGTLNNETGFCICSDGWMTAPIDKDQYDPGLSIYHMCNMRLYSLRESRDSKLKQSVLIICIIGTVIAILLLVISFICHAFYTCMCYHLPSSSGGSSFASFSSNESVDLSSARVLEATSAESVNNVVDSYSYQPSEDTIYRITELNEGMTQTDHEKGQYDADSSSSSREDIITEAVTH